MRIANPIYDVVFRFMMEDLKIAKAFISAIIGEKVLELEFAPQEHTGFIDKDELKEIGEEEYSGTCITVCRFDFSAKVETPGGHKTVMIELQKAKLSTDLVRFRRYLGQHYRNRSNTCDENRLKARQIYCIFLLGYDVGIPGRPVIRVDQKIVDAVTSECLDSSVSNEFICGLHHRSWIVQIAQLKKRRRNDVEKLLSVFDQEYRTQDDRIMNIREEEYPREFRPIIRRLQMAGESEKIRKKMELEDDYLEELREKEREAERERTEKNKAVEEKNKALEEKDKALEEKDKVLEEKDKALEEMAKRMEELRRKYGE